ncbi:MAG: phage NinH family protein [Pantoea sp.]|uniref:phage NinH family protein n=1 Tax=Enterobacterales TaxID=91347 RepID=UPI001CF0ACF6|nr:MULTISPECIES: phage NinH family protein [Enterobacterales]MCA6629683.1 phage NinH family protein [Salmonella enterica]MDU7837659.1 phage NinH family protein [Pantoea sp.]
MGKAIVQTIPELLVETRGNMAAVGRMTGIARQTVKCYACDVDGKKHAIVNGVLMVAQGNRGPRKKGESDAKDLVHS